MNTLRRLNKNVLIGGGVIIVGIIGLIIWWVAMAHTTSPPKPDPNTPSFHAVLPKGKTAASLGGWQKLTPPSGETIYVFVDTLNGIALNVSQQELPESFKADTSTKIAELAKSYNATSTFDAGSTKVYIGTSAQGPQSVIFTKNGLLVLIKSQKQISNQDWATYIQSLS
jgi:hypothetical protein